jgi:hypothetical protein
VLRESARGRNQEKYPEASEYSIKKYKVRVRRPRRNNQDNDSTLLVSYSQESAHANGLANGHDKYKTGRKIPSHESRLPPYPPYNINGPGSELVAKLIDGNESVTSEETVKEEFGVVYPPHSVQAVFYEGQAPEAAHLATVFSSATQQSLNEQNSSSSQNFSSGDTLSSKRHHRHELKNRKHVKNKKTSSYESSNSTQMSGNKLDRDEAVEERIQSSSRLSGSVRKALQTFEEDDSSTSMKDSLPRSPKLSDEQQTSVSKATPVMSRASLAPSTPIESTTPFTSSTARVSNARNISSSQFNPQSTSKANLDHTTSKEDIEKKINARNTLSQVETTFEIMSIGPGSTAGGSLYNFEMIKKSPINDAKSAFSEYTKVKSDY